MINRTTMLWGKPQGDGRWSRGAIVKHVLHLCLYVSILVSCQFTVGIGPFPPSPHSNDTTLGSHNISAPSKFKRSLFNHRAGDGPPWVVGVGGSSVLLDEYEGAGAAMLQPSYGQFWIVLLYVLRCLNLIALPLMIFHFCGLVLYPAFPDPPKPPSTPTRSSTQPFICFRVVTRGTFPHLVRRNLGRNLATCLASGFLKDNFVIQVVSDRPLNLLHRVQDQSPTPSTGDLDSTDNIQGESLTRGGGNDEWMQAHSRLIKELVVPDEYQTPRGSLYKARALQYALEDGNHFLHTYHDWIVHLDEETLLSPDSVVGIWNFVNNASYDFGQGLITYANDGVVNWLTTLADTFRVADDMGKQRFQLKCLHAPLFNWKGSYVVTRAAAERVVSFDVGPHGSIAEDCYFAMAAIAHQNASPPPPPPSPPLQHHLAIDLDGVENNHVSFEMPGSTDPNKIRAKSPFYDRLNFRFDFIEGEMWEKSPFTVSDFLKQRKRWLQGIYLVVHRCPEIPLWTSKLCLTLFVYAWILMPIIVAETVLINRVWPVPTPAPLRTVSAFISGTTIYMYVFGALKSFGSRCWGPPSSPTNNYFNGPPQQSIAPSRRASRSVRFKRGSTPARRSRRMRRLFRALSRRLGTYSRCCCCYAHRRRTYSSLSKEGQGDVMMGGGQGCTRSPLLLLTGCLKCGLCVCGALAVIPFNVVIEVVAVVWGLVGAKDKFYIVSKQMGPDSAS